MSSKKPAYCGKKIAEGKTKVVYAYNGDSGLCVIYFKDDITAGDGAKHDVMENKGAIHWETCTNIFGKIRDDTSVPIAFVDSQDERYMIARRLQMFPFEPISSTLLQ